MSWWGPSESAFWGGVAGGGGGGYPRCWFETWQLSSRRMRRSADGDRLTGNSRRSFSASTVPSAASCSLSVIFLLPPSSGVVGGSALQSRAEVPKLEGCLSLLSRVRDSTTPCSGNANPVE
ncbi:hypothetical protein C4D60_Mb08t20740 [Musa balbisiana]|uniref:Uncharacterized protein n=1 Tax=Musa balbisiana TaxID=52838 RepID=A0A4S8K5A2_MUSBA|nr:hypothetical protein C4D60_Mb08t20740 [Musa balbisiana]